MTEAHIRRYASRTALEHVDGVVAVIWADGTREEFSRTSRGGAPLAGEAAVLTDACLSADAVYGESEPMDDANDEQRDSRRATVKAGLRAQGVL